MATSGGRVALSLEFAYDGEEGMLSSNGLLEGMCLTRLPWRGRWR